MRRVFVFIVLVIAAGVSLAQSPEGESALSDPGTERAWRTRCAEIEYRDMRAWYAQQGEAARAKLRSGSPEADLIWAASLAYTGAWPESRLDSLIESGLHEQTDDVLVRAIVAPTLASGLSEADEIAALRTALDNLVAARGPKIRIAGLAKSLHLRAKSAGDAANDSHGVDQMIRYALWRSSDNDVDSDLRRHVFEKFIEFCAREFTQDRLVWLREWVDSYPQMDSWLAAMIRGEVELTTAWNRRGVERAHLTSPEQFEAFHRHLELARDHFIKAWEIDPACPEAAARMIRVTMGGRGQSGVSARAWFDRAGALEIDHALAHEYFLVYSLPRWSGSHAALMALAQEQAGVEGHASNRPYWALHTLGWLYHEFVWAGEEEDFWLLKPAIREVLDALDAYVELAKPKTGIGSMRDPDWIRSCQVWLAQGIGDIDRAGRYLRKIDGRLNLNAMQKVDQYHRSFGAEVLPFVSPGAGLATQARDQESRELWAEAAALWRDAASACGPSDLLAGRACRWRAVAAERQARFESGEWVELRADDAMSGFVSWGAPWRAGEDGAFLIGSTGDRAESLWAPISTGGDVVMECRVEIPGEHSDFLGAGLLFAECQIANSTRRTCRTAAVWPGQAKGAYALYWQIDDQAQRPIAHRADAYDIRVVRRGDQGAVWVDGERVAAGPLPTDGPQFTPDSQRVGIGVWNPPGDGEVRFTGWRVRRATPADIDPHDPIEF